MTRTTWGVGVANRRLYQVWKGMRARCQNPNHEAFKNYGGRGIKVCDRWQSFENFLADMGDPGSGFSLERENNSGNYDPTNVRWATRREQSLNHRRNVILELDGESMTAKEWADKLGIKPRTLLKRLYDGWTVEKALTTPVRKPA